MDLKFGWKSLVNESVNKRRGADCLSPHPTYVVIRWLLLLGILALAGCSDRGPERVAVQGSIQFGGRPISDGVIRFIPLEGTPGPKTSTGIVNGKYRLNAESGPPVGRLRVEIRQGQTVPPGMTMDDAAVGSKKYQLPPNKIPAQFNTNSSLSVEAVAGKINTFDFDLKASR